MNIEQIREYCIRKKGVTESFPFDDKTLVFKVMNKMFALLSLSELTYLNLKCEPELAISLREQFSYVKPGYHMNKKHWNSVFLKDERVDRDVKEWIDHSYNLVVNSLTNKLKDELNKT